LPNPQPYTRSRSRRRRPPRRYLEAFAAAASLAPVVERFFDEALVMAEDSSIRSNRLALLGQLRDEFGRLGDFLPDPALAAQTVRRCTTIA
jgi:glycyl-tRNA synthetase beta subunit